MKKALSLILTLVLCLGLCACGNRGKIQLTLDNYSDYLSVSVRNMQNGEKYAGNHFDVLSGYSGIRYQNGVTKYVYEYLNGVINVEGVSPNFNYKDVTVTVKFTGRYKSVDTETAEWSRYTQIGDDTTLTVSCNISGNGEISKPIIGDGGKSGYLLLDMADIDWEIVSVSGYVVPA